MAGALSSGEDEAEFLRREAEIIGESYGNLYERDVETMKKWTDAYVTLLVASGLIVVVAVISMMIYEVGVFVIVGLALMMVGATCLGAWILYASAPREIKTRVTGPSSKLQKLAAGLFRVEGPLAIATTSVMLLIGVDLGWVLITGALLILPTGIVANMDDKRVGRIDMDISTVVRVLGGMTAAIGSTISESVSRVDHRSMGALMPEVTRLSYRLEAGIDPSLCWNALVDECGSELVDRTVQMFYNPLSLGGEPALVGNASAYFSSRIAFLRATRSMVAATFRWLTLPLHTAMVALLQFIVEIMRIFTGSLNQTDTGAGSSSGTSGALSGGDLITFGQVDIGMVSFLVTFVVLVLTFVNALAPKAADGGHSFKILYNLSTTMVITGALMLLVPWFADSLFGSIMNG
jgi:flagellar protein FlaJ